MNVYTHAHARLVYIKISWYCSIELNEMTLMNYELKSIGSLVQLNYFPYIRLK